MVVEANRSRSDLVNLNVAAGEDERATQGRSPIEHFVVGITESVLGSLTLRSSPQIWSTPIPGSPPSTTL